MGDSLCWTAELRTGEVDGSPLQHSCLENPMDGGAWGAAVYGIAQSRARLKHLSRTNNRASRWLRGKEFACQCKRGKRYRCDPQVGKIPWRRRRQPTPVLLPGESHEQRRPGGSQSRT